MTAWKIEEVQHRAELDAITDFLVDHSDDSRHVFFPVSDDSGGHGTSLRAHRDRLWREHMADTSSHWMFVRDPATLSSSKEDDLVVIGACQWRFYNENPFPDGMPDVTATWWAEGSSGRAFATDFTRQIMGPRSKWMNRPHVGLSWIAVLPSQRQKGVGKALMAWGMQHIDRLGLESYIEGSELGRLLYSSCGYRLVTRLDFEMTTTATENNDGTWRRLEQLTLPSCINVMWRPPRGIWVEGEPEKTWRDRIG